MMNITRFLFPSVTCVALFFLNAGIVHADTFIREVAESFTVQPGQSLTIDANAADIQVSPEMSGTLTVQVLLHARAGSESKAEKIFDRADIRFNQSENQVRLDIDSVSGGSFLGLFGSDRPDVTVSVTCPPSFNLDLDTGSGSIQVEGISGDLVLDTGSGSISGSRLQGSVHADTGSGNIVIDGLQGDLIADTGSGSISAAGLSGAFTGDTGSGSISVSGSLSRFSADTGSGSVTIRSQQPPLNDSLVDTGSGSIAVFLPVSSAFQLDAQSASGSVSVDFPNLSNVEASGNTFAATVNQGSVNIVLDAGSGNVSVGTHD
jgi:hypothetical protein